ncbi:MAG: helical backbone metal receptor [Owenweeksia sp.]
MIGSLTDPTGSVIPLPRKPLRIVSTVPSQTELLVDLGLEEELVVITAYCVHPKSLLSRKTIIGGTKNLQLDRIRSLKPDLIIGNKEENIKEQIEGLQQDFPVWISDIRTVDDALKMISDTGILTHREKKSEEILKKITHERNKLQAAPSLRVAYLIWKEPFMLAGHDTFIGNMLNECGLKNVAPKGKERYPAVDLEGLKNLQPDLILLSSEPYSFTTSDAHIMAGQILQTLVKIVDGELFSWYGSRMKSAFQYFQVLCNELKLSFSQNIQ